MKTCSILARYRWRYIQRLNRNPAKTRRALESPQVDEAAYGIQPLNVGSEIFRDRFSACRRMKTSGPLIQSEADTLSEIVGRCETTRDAGLQPCLELK